MVESRPFVTETMAELYEQQGHRDEALKVYRALLDQRPGDAHLQQRIAALEAKHGPTIRELIAQVAARRPRAVLSTQPPAATADEFSGVTAETTPARDAGAGASVTAAAPPETAVPGAAPGAPTERADALATLFGSPAIAATDESAARMLAAVFRRNGSPAGTAEAPPIAGAPARPATKDLSLDSVFGGAGGQSSNFSFDQFFSQRATAEKPVTPARGGAQESTEDVARFTQWLEGLKQR